MTLLSILVSSQYAFANELDTEIAACSIRGCATEHTAQDALLHSSTGDQMKSFFQNLLTTSNWPPRWSCGTWTDFHGWLYILSDIGIWAAYFAIPVVLGLFLFKRRKTGLPFPGIFTLFIVFIFSCGLTHLIDAVIFWIPVYNFSGLVRFITAVVSIGTVFALVKVTPKVLNFKSPEELEKIIHQRTEQLKSTNRALETTNDQLAEHIREKEKARQEINSLIESIPQIAWTTTAEGKLNYVNDQWWKYTGMKRESDIPEWDHFFHPDDLEEVKTAWRHSVETNEEFFAEGRIRMADDTYQWFLMKALPIKDENNETQKWIGTFTDIHEQKISEQRKDTFLNIASHELRTPLTIIRAYSELISRHSLIQGDEGLKMYTSKVEKHIEKLENLIMELLDVSRVGSGNMRYEMKPEDFDTIIKDCVRDFENINKTNHQIKLTGNTQAQVMCDEEKISQIMHNLLANAIKYSSEDQPIIIQLKKDDGYVRCSVRDRGVGIKEEEIGNIFKRFYRTVDNDVVGGLGLGLYISDEIIKEHNGNIEVDSKAGKGSTFTVCLPIKG